MSKNDSPNLKDQAIYLTCKVIHVNNHFAKTILNKSVHDFTFLKRLEYVNIQE